MKSDRLTTSFALVCLTVMLACLSFCSCGNQRAVAQTKNAKVSIQDYPERALGWYLSAHTYTFNRFTFVEAVEKAKQAGVNTIEAFPGQKLGGDMEGRFDVDLSQENKRAVRDLLKQSGVELIALGVANGSKEEGWRALFAFAKEMGIQVVNVEPNPADLPMIGKLADEFRLRIAIHNHPKPSKYWDPAFVLQCIAQANSPYVGACADIGHWVRSGLDPVECLRILDGHVFSLHFKDLKEKDPKTHDVHWGTGVANVKGVIAELKRQGFKGNISAEYEYNWEDNVGDVRQSVQNFRELLK